MGFLRGSDDEGPETEELARIEGGGIPTRAEQRLRELAGEGALFTSGLSVNEFALLQRMGPRPLAQVMGASVIRTGWQYLPALPPGQIVAPGGGSWGQAYSTNRFSAYQYQNRITEPSPGQMFNYKWHTDVVCELDVLTDAWSAARRRALDRLSEEALQVNADAVVGVRLHRAEHDLGQGTIEYVVTGTAIRMPGSDASTWPILTDLSVQDYWRLHRAGHEPVGLLATTAVVFASPSTSLRMQRTRTLQRNQELNELSRAFRIARETVRARIEGQVSDAHGAGAVGVELSHAIHRDKLPVASSLGTVTTRGWHRGQLGLPYLVTGRGDTERRGWVITMHGSGTAVRRRTASSAPPVKPIVRLGVT